MSQILATHRARGWALRRKSDGYLWQIGEQGLEYPLALSNKPDLGNSSAKHWERIEVERVVTIRRVKRPAGESGGGT